MFAQVGKAIKAVLKFFSKNTKTLTTAAVIAETIIDPALIPLTKTVGAAVEQGAKVLDEMEFDEENDTPAE